jgi:hypothetical protein
MLQMVPLFEVFILFVSAVCAQESSAGSCAGRHLLSVVYSNTFLLLALYKQTNIPQLHPAT